MERECEIKKEGIVETRQGTGSTQEDHGVCVCDIIDREKQREITKEKHKN